MSKNQQHTGAHRYDVASVECPVLLVGEDNPQSARPEHALYPYPVGCAGHNLSENILEVGMGHSLATWRTNLCSPRWSAKEARARARELVVTDGVPWRVIVMLGRKVAEAFEAAFRDSEAGFDVNPPLGALEPFGTRRIIHRIREAPNPTTADVDWITLVSLPHPSGRCRVWNDLAQVHRARALLAEVAPTWYGECNT